MLQPRLGPVIVLVDWVCDFHTVGLEYSRRGHPKVPFSVALQTRLTKTACGQHETRQGISIQYVFTEMTNPASPANREVNGYALFGFMID